jgi:protein ImuB
MDHERHRRTDAQASATTTLDIALAEPSRDPARLVVVLRERMAQLELPATTLELRLLADDIARRAPPNNELFPTPQSEQDGRTCLIERLQARLGPAQVQRLEGGGRPPPRARQPPVRGRCAHWSAGRAR